MGKQRRRHKLTTSDDGEHCENCRLVQRDSGKYGKRNSLKGSKQLDILNFLALDCESETDSAIDTASISSSSDDVSILSASDSATELSSIDDSCRVVSVPKRSKVAEVSIADIEKEEADLDLVALAEFVSGVSFQKFTTRDSCMECIQSYQRAVHIHEHNHMQMCGIDDSFTIDLTAQDIEVHIEEFSNWSLGNTTVQRKEHGYYVSPQGATYYTDIPMDTKVSYLPRQLMIPPSERSMCKLHSPIISFCISSLLNCS